MTRAQTVLKVDSGVARAQKAKSGAELLKLAGCADGAPPDWLHFTDASGAVIASPAAGLVARCIDGNEFHDDFFEEGRLIARPRDVNEMGTSRTRKLSDALVSQIFAYDHEGSVVFALRWLGEVPTAKTATRLWAAAFEAYRGQLPEWEPPAPPSAVAAAPAAPSAIRAVWLGSFERRNAFEGKVWAKAPRTLKAVQAPVHGGERGGDPFVLDGVVFGAGDSTVGALDVRAAKPRPQWQTTLASGSNVVMRGGFVDGDALVVCLTDRLCTLELSDGRLRESVKVAGIVSEPVRFEDTWAVTTKLGVVAIDLASRRKRWTCAFPNKYATGGLALSAGTLFTSPDALFAIDARTGKVQWKALSIAGQPVVSGDTVYAASLGAIHSLDARTGKKRWSKRVNHRHGARLALGAGVLAFRCDDGSVLALDERTGAERWRVAGTESTPSSAPTFVGDCALFVQFHDALGNSCELLAVDAKSGRVRWRVPKLPGGMLDQPQWHSPVAPSFSPAGVLETLVLGTGWGALVVRP